MLKTLYNGLKINLTVQAGQIYQGSTFFPFHGDNHLLSFIIIQEPAVFAYIWETAKLRQIVDKT